MFRALFTLLILATGCVGEEIVESIDEVCVGVAGQPNPFWEGGAVPTTTWLPTRFFRFEATVATRPKRRVRPHEPAA